MIRRPTESSRTCTLFPSTSLFRSHRPHCNQASRAMGFASLYPSYGLALACRVQAGPPTMPCPRTARSRPMRHLPLAALATAVLGLSGCTWVHMAPGAKAVQVMAAAPTGCEKRGEVSVSVADKVALVYERNDLRVREELDTLARNEDPGIGADTLSPPGPPLHGDQQFAARPRGN